jgi:hypothetical protein
MGFSKTDPALMKNTGYDLLALYELEYQIFEDV